MHYKNILEKMGCGPKRLREIFTAEKLGESCPDDASPSVRALYDSQEAKTNSAIRQRFECRVRSRTFDGVETNCRTARPFQAVDLAWDAAPIQKETIPLMLFASGKINAQRACDSIFKSLSPSAAAKFVKKSGDDNTIMELDVPRISEIRIDLMRSYITRRLAAMDALWANLWPLYRYDPRGQDAVTMLRADVVTQRVDIISDGYNYRHHDTQCRRDMLLYGSSMIFPRSSWDRQIGWRPKPTNTGEPGDEIESYVTREGIEFVNPHPSRIFYDLSSPLANINADIGPRWVGYWDLMRWSDIANSDANYFNLENVALSTGWTAIVERYNEFFAQYFDPCVMKWPEFDGATDSIGNDRNAQIGRYTSKWTDRGVLVTQYFERINPKREGIGDYDCDVWIRLVVAGDCTVVGAEFMPSLPGAYGGINCNDSRTANQSMGMALLAYQDQAGNIVSQMLQQVRAGFMQLWLIDKDSLDEPIRKEIEANAANSNWWVDPKVLTYSATKLRDLGIQDPKQAFVIIQNQMNNAVSDGLTALARLLDLADRLLILSPNELGQPIQRESSAREVQEIATSVQSIYSFINEGPREQVAAKKELIYESLVTNGSQSVRVPVTNKYTVKTIKEAGFTTANIKDLKDGDVVHPKTPIMGSLHNLVYDYYFDSRDGAERVVNTQGAQVVMQLLQSILQIPQLSQKMGLGFIYDMVNLVIRLSGAPTDYQFETTDGQDDTMPSPAPAQPDQSQQVQQLTQQVQRIESILQQVMSPQQPGLNQPGGAPAPAQTPAAAGPPQPAGPDLAQMLSQPMGAAA
jgi:hypothetical protein